MNEAIRRASAVLEGESLEIATARALAAIPAADVMDLVALANRVRQRFSPQFQACSIINAKSGSCSEDCRFCAQSTSNSAEIKKYPLASVETIVTAAKTAYSKGIRSFCVVTSGYGMKDADTDFEGILKAIDAIHRECPGMGVSASLGMLSETTARLLSEHRIEHYNINLQTAPEKYVNLISRTHKVEERMETIRMLKRFGVAVCSGGILGVGETMEDRVALAFALKELKVEVIPLNVLVPIEGTPLEGAHLISALEVAKTVSLFRLINPFAVIKLAAGRETVMKDFQGLLMLAGANGFITGGYLTTRGREVEQDADFVRELEAFEK